MVLNSPDGRYLKDKEVAEALAGQLTKAGIRTTVKTFEWGTYLNQMQYVHGGGPLSLFDWANTTWDADGTLTPLFRSGKIFVTTSTSRTTACSTRRPRPSARRPARRSTPRRCSTLMDDAPAIPLYQQVDIYGVARRVKFQALSSEQLVGVRVCLADQTC